LVKIYQELTRWRWTNIFNSIFVVIIISHNSRTKSRWKSSTYENDTLKIVDSNLVYKIILPVFVLVFVPTYYDQRKQ